MNAIRTAFPIFGFWDTRQGGRAENQDSCGFVDTPHGLIAVVCDGMGGGPAGKEASILAVQTIADYFSKQPVSDDLESLMRNAVEHAHQAIINKAKDHQEMRGMGSTVVAVLFHPKAAVVAHVGDSRVYQFRQGNKVFRTEDHSLVAEMVRSKELTEEQARLSGQTNVITKALGGKNGHLVDVEILPYERGDRFLLCTDGVWNALSEKDLITRAAQTPSLAGAVDSIVLQADELGRKNGNTHDNLTLALFETKQDSITKVKMNRKAIKIICALVASCIVCLLTIIVMAINLIKQNDEYGRLKQSNNNLLKEYAIRGDSLNRANRDIDSLLDRKPTNVNTTFVIKEEEQETEETLEEPAGNKADNVGNKVTLENGNQQIISDIDSVTKVLNNLINSKDFSNKTAKKNKLDDVIKKLQKISSRDNHNERFYQSIIDELNKDKVKNSNSKEAKDIINKQIEALNKIKEKL